MKCDKAIARHNCTTGLYYLHSYIYISLNPNSNFWDGIITMMFYSNFITVLNRYHCTIIRPR